MPKRMASPDNPDAPEYGELPGTEKTRTITRSISLPVQECLSHSWQYFNKLLHASWRHSTDLANWARHTLTRLDVTRTPGMRELPPMPAVDLYATAFGRARESLQRERVGCSGCKRKWFPSQARNGAAPEHQRGKTHCAGSGQPVVALERGSLPIMPQDYDGAAFWDGAKVAAASLLRGVLRKYSKERGAVIWLRERRSVEYQYPHPFPVHQQAWVASFTEKGQPLVSMGLPGGRLTVRLRGGAEFASQLRILRLIADGAVKQSELKICRQRSQVGAGVGHYRAGSEQKAGGSNRVSYRIMLRISCQIPVGADSQADLSATVRTSGDPLLTLTIADQQPWLLHVPQVRGWIVAHRRLLDQMSDDLKFEKRWPRGKRRRMLGRLERGCEKHACRMKTFRQQTAAMVVGHAQRRGCGAIVWDDADRSFINRDFPWFELREDVKNKCDELGLKFVVAASAPVLETVVAGDNGATAD